MNDRIGNALRRVAAALNMLESADSQLTCYFEQNDYNDEVLYQLREAAGKLGYVLACLTTWDEAIEEEGEGETETKGFDVYYRGQKVGESKDGLSTYKETTSTSDNKPYSLAWVCLNGTVNSLGYYKTIEDAAAAVSGFGLDDNISKEEVLDAWNQGKHYKIDSVGSFIVENTDESEN